MTMNLDNPNQLPKIRSADEMLALILSTAQADERIRAVVLNGSRANPNVVPDRFQDFDILFVVTDVASFVDVKNWIDRFGERLIMQTPTLMGDPPPDPGNHFTYLMQFKDGNRIDLTLVPIDRMADATFESLSILLLDKDNQFTTFPPPSESSYFPKSASAKVFEDCCNEFWWVSPYVAKSLARDEIIYAHYLLENVLRPQLMLMLTWLFGIKTDFKRNPGKGGKHFREVLSPDRWTLLLETYSEAEDAATWKALFNMGRLFRVCGLEVADACEFDYPDQTDHDVRFYLQSIRESIQTPSVKNI